MQKERRIEEKKEADLGAGTSEENVLLLCAKWAKQKKSLPVGVDTTHACTLLSGATVQATT